MARGEGRPMALPVLGSRELRASFGDILMRFRELGAKAPPVFFGSRRKPEGVFLPYERYERMLDDLDNTTIVTLVEERLPAADARLGDDLDDVARDLGFDPDEIFTKR